MNNARIRNWYLLNYPAGFGLSWPEEKRRKESGPGADWGAGNYAARAREMPVPHGTNQRGTADLLETKKKNYHSADFSFAFQVKACILPILPKREARA